MGLNADVYKTRGGDCSNGGLSSRADRVCIVNVPGPFEPHDDIPAVALVHGNVPGTVKMIPVKLALNAGQPAPPLGRHDVRDADGRTWTLSRPEGSAGPMMGGCYVGTPDSRLANAVHELTGARDDRIVPLHDRFEGSPFGG